jgi:hypothetical protein
VRVVLHFCDDVYHTTFLYLSEFEFVCVKCCTFFFWSLHRLSVATNVIFSGRSIYKSICIRDRPFNLKRGVMVFCFVQNLFSDNTRVRIFFCRAKREFFFPVFNIRLYHKNSESDYFLFPPPKSEYFFQQHWESEYFLEKKHTPPFQVKWSFPNISLIKLMRQVIDFIMLLKICI